MANNAFRILIVDSCPEARADLATLLAEIKNVEVVGEADNAETAIYKIIKYYPNLILLDNNLSGITSFDLVELIKRRNVDVPVVLVSSHKEYAIQAIRNQIYDFIVKPVNVAVLENTIEKYRRLNRSYLPGKLMDVLSSIKEEHKIRLNSRHSYILITPSEIVFCKSEDGGTSIQLTSGKTEFSNISLTQLQSILEGQNFYRLGRSVLLNLDYVRGVNKITDAVLMKHGENYYEVFASHKSIKDILESYFSYA